MVMSGKMQDGMNISFNKSLVMNELPSGDALKVHLGNWLLDNPVIPASGTFGYGYEFAELYDINCLGTFSFKGTTLGTAFRQPHSANCRMSGGHNQLHRLAKSRS